MKRLGVYLWCCTILLLWQGASMSMTTAALDAVDICLREARDNAAQEVQKGLSRAEARRRLEIDAVACQHPQMSAETAAFIGTVNADLARFGHDFLLGNLSGLAYRQARLDRSRKLDDFRDDVAFHKELATGDADGDLVPDSGDQCPDTPDGTPTNDVGCPDPGDIRPPGGSEEVFRRLLTAGKTLHNESCAGAPQPPRPQPLAWGRSHSINGIKLVVAEVGGMPPGCELFYEIHLHFIDPTSTYVPASADIGVVFQEAEDLDSDPTTAAFGLPVGVPLSPGRTAALNAFLMHYQKVTWRVRAANGAALTSPWSPMITQGSASGGIP